MSKLWRKATAAARSAHTLFQDGDFDGAANRAYYAMFSAARGFLEAGGHIDATRVRKHSAVLRLFSLHAVKTGAVDAQLNKALNRAFEERAKADYDGDSVLREDVAATIELMDRLLADLAEKTK